MERSYLGLRGRAFGSTPDPDTYYPAGTHEAALAQLQHSLDDGDAVVVLVAAPGMGKTLLLHRLAQDGGDARQTVMLPACRFAGRADLLQAILFDLGLPYAGRPEQELRLAVTEAALEHYRGGKPLLVLCDEAQHLSPDLLEEIRLLSNLEARGGKAIQVVLAGQPDLLATLRRPELTSLRQRLGARTVLEPLDVAESADYLLHHLRRVTPRPENVVSSEALHLLAQGAGGVPRLLNQAGHMALQLASAAEQTSVDVEAALEALTALGLTTDELAMADDVPINVSQSA